MKFLLFIIFSVIIFLTNLFANTIHVPSQQPTIQAGINTASDFDTVLVDTGLYVENINYNGKNIVVGSLFLITSDTSYISQTVIDGGNNQAVVLFENGEDSTAILCGFTITNGWATDGAGVSSYGSGPTLRNLLITGNFAQTNGGGVWCGYSSTITLEEVLVSNNSANFDGGGICVIGGSNPRIYNSIINENSAEVGAGIYCADSELSLVSVSVNGNSALSEGGGMQSHFSNLHIDSCIFLNNDAQGNYGGGINYFNDGDPGFSGITFQIETNNSRFIGNSSYNITGGACIAQSNSDSSFINATINNCEFAENSANQYSGLRIYGRQVNFNVSNSRFINNECILYGAGAAFTGNCKGELSNCLISSNISTTGSGAGIDIWSGAIVNIMNCNFTDNIASYGAGLTVGGGGVATTTNCIFWGNHNNQIALDSYNNLGGTLTIDFCNVQGGMDSVYISDPLSTLNWNSNNLNSDPLFWDSANLDYHLSDYSPCIGSGTSSGAPATDIDGNLRPNPPGSNPDMGIYENVLGAPLQGPNITILEDTLNFGQVFIGITDSLELEVQNTGNLDLLISNVTINPIEYTVSPSFASIDPGSNEIFTITFLPQSIGNYPGTLTFTSNDPDSSNYLITLIGQGVEPPIIFVSPDSFSSALFTGDTIMQTLTISNTGNSDLFWNIDLDNIGLGTVTFTKQDYADWTDSANQDRITDNVYITRADNQGIFNAVTEMGYNYALSPEGTEWAFGYSSNLVSSDYQSWREAVNYNPPSMVGQPISLHLLSDDKYFDVLFHDWTSNNNGGGFSYTRTDIDSVWLSVSLDSGIVPAGNLINIDVTIDAAGLFGGDYMANIVINSNDPLSQQIEIPVHLNVTGVPDITVLISPYDSISTIYWYNTGGSTVHNFYPAFPAVGDAELTITIDGDYNDINEYADVYVESYLIGTINPDIEGPTTQEFTITETDLNNYLNDGIVSVTVVNSPNVDPWHGNDFHSVQLAYSGGNDSLDFGEVFVNYPSSRKIILENTGTDLLDVSSITIDSTAFSINPTSAIINYGESDTVIVTLLSPSVGNYTGMLTIVSNDPDQGTISVPLLGEASISPIISVAPDSLSDVLMAGDSSTHTITFFNNGGSDLNFEVSNSSYNHALQFDGSDDYLDVPHVAFNNLPVGSVELWIKYYALDRDLLYKETYNATTISGMRINYDGTIEGSHNNFWGNDDIVSSSVLSIDTWYHIVWTWDGTNQKLFITGELDTIQPSTDGVADDLNGWLHFGGGDTYFDGIIDEIRFWNVARTQSEIQEDMYRELSGNETGLIGYWQLNEGAGISTIDLTSNNNDGTLQGGTDWISSTAPILTWLYCVPVSGTITASDSLVINAHINTTDMTGGIYEQNIIINSNDPSQSQLLIPVHLAVTPSGIEDLFSEIPKKFILFQNYPNPFNPVTHIRFGLPKISDVKIELYNILGQRIVTLLEERKPAGYHVINFDASQFASGVYIYRIEAGSFVKSKKMLLIK